MSIFGFYFVSSMLREAGWPRKKGILGREVIDTTIADAITEQMTEWAAALGAGRPSLALQMIAEMFRDRDWSSANAPQIKTFIEGAELPDDGPPKPMFQLAQAFGKTISPKDMSDKRLSAGFEQCALHSLLWGLAKPERFAEWFNARAQKQREMMPLAQRAGLQVDALPDLAQFLQFSEDILRDYERNVGQLPPIPPKLLSDARALGLRI